MVHSLAKNAAIVFLGVVISRVLGYVFRLIIARIGVVEYGLYNLGTTALNIAFLIGSVGLFTGVTRFIAQYLGEKKKSRINEIINTALTLCIPVSVVLSLLMFFFAGEISQLFGDESLAPVLRIISGIVPFAIVTEIFLSVTDAFKMMHIRIFTTDIARDVMKLILLAAFIAMGYGLFGALVALLLSTVFSAILSYLFIVKLIPMRYRVTLDAELIRYSYPNFFSKFLGSIYGWMDTLMIGILLGTTAVGVYNAALPTAMLLLLAPTCILSVFLPVITEAHTRKKNVNGLFRIVTKWIYFVNLPLALVMVLFAPQLLRILFGAEYAPAAPTLIVLTLGFFIHALWKANGYALHLMKKTGTIFFVTLGSMILNVVLNMILIRHFGILGAAIATAVTYLIISGIYLHIAKKMLAISLWDVRYIRGLFAAGIPFGVGYSLFRTTELSAISMGSMVILVTVAYALLLLCFRCVDKNDAYLIRLLLRKMGTTPRWIDRFLE